MKQDPELDFAVKLRTALEASTRRTRWGEVQDPIAQDVLSFEDTFARLAETLRAIGLTEASPLSGGASSVVLNLDNDRVLRLGVGRLVTRPAVPEVLQPEACGTVGTLRYEILPRADTQSVTDADVAALTDRLASRGYRWDDRSIDNAGRVNGVPVIIDPGGITSLRPSHTAQQNRKGQVMAKEPPKAESPERRIANVLQDLAKISKEQREFFDDISEDSYATRIEMSAVIVQLDSFLREIEGATPGGLVDLRRIGIDYGIDPEEAFADRSAGLEYVPKIEREQSLYENTLWRIEPQIDKLQEAGVTVKTGFHRFAEYQFEPRVLLRAGKSTTEFLDWQEEVGPELPRAYMLLGGNALELVEQQHLAEQYRDDPEEVAHELADHWGLRPSAVAEILESLDQDPEAIASSLRERAQYVEDLGDKLFAARPGDSIDHRIDPRLPPNLLDAYEQHVGEIASTLTQLRELGVTVETGLLGAEHDHAATIASMPDDRLKREIERLTPTPVAYRHRLPDLTAERQEIDEAIGRASKTVREDQRQLNEAELEVSDWKAEHPIRSTLHNWGLLPSRQLRQLGDNVEQHQERIAADRKQLGALTEQRDSIANTEEQARMRAEDEYQRDMAAVADRLQQIDQELTTREESRAIERDAQELAHENVLDLGL